MTEIPPALIYLLGLLFVPFLSGHYRKGWVLLIGLSGFVLTVLSANAPDMVIHFIPGIETVLFTTDAMRQLAGGIFALSGLLVLIYASYRPLPALETMGVLASVGAALGVVYAGDFITVFLFWELLAIAALAIIWSSRDPASSGAGLRYLLFHIFGGACLLGGIVYTVAITGTAAVDQPVAEAGFGYLLMLVGIGVNAGFILLHTWVPDAYPRASAVGSVALCIFTTKAAVFMLAVLGGLGSPVAYIGGVMALYGALFALMQDDIRALLSYSIISQGGYMVAAVGVGTLGGIDACLAHMVNDILFKSLLFMAAGAVIIRTGRNLMSESGGLYHRMPLTALCAVIGGLALAGLPGLNGAVSKGMVIDAAHDLQYLDILLLASAVITVIYVARLLYLVFFRTGERIESEPSEAPMLMLIPMGVLALLCIIIGLFPDLLTSILPGGSVAQPFSPSHLTESAAIFGVAGLLLALIRPLRTPWRRDRVDIDILYIRIGKGVTWFSAHPLSDIAGFFEGLVASLKDRTGHFLLNPPVACQITGRRVMLPLVRCCLPSPSAEVFERDLATLTERYPYDQINIWGGGYGIVFISFITFIYFIYYILK